MPATRARKPCLNAGGFGSHPGSTVTPSPFRMSDADHPGPSPVRGGTTERGSSFSLSRYIQVVRGFGGNHEASRSRQHRFDDHRPARWVLERVASNSQANASGRRTPSHQGAKSLALRPRRCGAGTDGSWAPSVASGPPSTRRGRGRPPVALQGPAGPTGGDQSDHVARP